MGIVYRALDTLLQRIVAVKVISAPIDTDPEPRERFFREARAAGQLSHKNIITIHVLVDFNLRFTLGQNGLSDRIAPLIGVEWAF